MLVEAAITKSIGKKGVKSANVYEKIFILDLRIKLHNFGNILYLHTYIHTRRFIYIHMIARYLINFLDYKNKILRIIINNMSIIIIV